MIETEELRAVSASQEHMAAFDSIDSGQIDWVVLNTTMTAV
jgi:hypothetical protein